MWPFDRKAKARRKRKILLCTLIPTAIVGVASAIALPLILLKRKNDSVMDGTRLSDLKVGDNLIGKYFLMPAEGWKISDMAWIVEDENTFISFSIGGLSDHVNMVIRQIMQDLTPQTYREEIHFSSNTYNHGGDAWKSICASVKNGTMNWDMDLGDISKNVAFKDYYYVQLSQENTGATKLEITEINLTTYDSAFDEFLSNCWVSNNIA